MQAGWNVDEAGSAKEALQRVSGDPAPDVIVLDYRLPDFKRPDAPREDPGDSARERCRDDDGLRNLRHARRCSGDGRARILNKPVEMRDRVPLVQEAYQARPGNAAP